MMDSGSGNTDSDRNAQNYESSTSTNTPPFSGQPAIPNFLFGSTSTRRSLLFSADGGDQTSTLSGKTQAQTNKSVHWSPNLIKRRDFYGNNYRDENYMDTSARKSTSKEAETFCGPPLRSMREELLSPPVAASNSFFIPVNMSARSDSQTQLELAAHWITVFGFSREDASNILKLFSRHGTIVAHQFPKEGNWIYLRYASPIHAQQALSRNGQILNGRLRIGVLPIEKYELKDLEDDMNLSSFIETNDENSSQYSLNRSTTSETSVLCGVSPLSYVNTAVRPLETSYNSSRIASPIPPGIRSLRASFNAADNRYRVNEGRQPEKTYGLLDKLLSFVS